MAKDLSIIIVSYNTEVLLKQCLDSLFKSLKGEAIESEIIVVDNASSDKTVEMLKESFPAIKIINNQINLGFAKANNQGISIAEGKFILLLNSDTLIVGKAITKMIAFIQHNSSIGIIGPKLYLDQEKTYHPSIKKFTTPYNILISFLPLGSLIRRFYNKLLLRQNRIREVDWLYGAALLIRRSLFERIGLLDENFFMYSEDEDLCYRANLNGYKIFYFPKAEIIHLKGKSSKREIKKLLEVFWESKLYYLAKYYPSAMVKKSLRMLVVILRMKSFLILDKLFKRDIPDIEKIINKKLEVADTRTQTY